MEGLMIVWRVIERRNRMDPYSREHGGHCTQRKNDGGTRPGRNRRRGLRETSSNLLCPALRGKLFGFDPRGRVF